MVIDLIFFIIFIYTFYVGFNRGIIKIIFVVIAYLIGFLSALRFSAGMRVFLETSFNAHGVLIPIVAFILTFIVTMFAIRLLANFLEKFLDKIDLETVNQFAGGILFATLGMSVYSGLLIFLEKARILSDVALSESSFFPFLKGFPIMIKDIITQIFPFVGNIWDKMMDSLDQAEQLMPKDSTNAQ